MKSLGIFIVNHRYDTAIPIRPNEAGVWDTDTGREKIYRFDTHGGRIPNGLTYEVIGERRSSGRAEVARLEWYAGGEDAALRDEAAWDDNRAVVEIFDTTAE